MDQKDPQSLDNASRDFLDVLQGDQRLSQARERERDQQRKRGGRATVTETGSRPETKARTAAPSGAPVEARPSGPLVAGQPGAETAGEAADSQPPLVAGQRAARPVADAPPRLPTGVAQQPPSAGLARAPLSGAAQVPAQPASQPAPGQQGAGPLALVDARTLAALASTLAAPQPTGRLVGPASPAGPMTPASAPLPGLGGETDKAALVGPMARPGVVAGQRQPAALSAVTPAEVRERVQMWMLTGILNTAPVRFPAIDPLQAGGSAAARQGVTRETAVSPFARGVAAKPSGAPPVTFPAANDAPGPASPLAANDGMPSLGQAMQQDHARRGGAIAAPNPPAHPSPGLAQQTRSAGGRDGRPDADRGGRAGAPRPLDFARAERAAMSGRGSDPQAPSRLDIPGLGVPRV